MEKEWAKWKKDGGYEYEEGWDDQDWANDLNEPKKAWDRYAIMNSNASMHQLKSEAVMEHEPGSPQVKSKQRKSKKHATKSTVEGAGKTEESQGTGEVAASKKRKKLEEKEPSVQPTDEKTHVNTIAKYLREILAGGWKVKKHEDLTKNMKLQFKEPFPPTEECRLNIYWKLGNVGVHLKGEGKDLATFSVHADAGPFLLRLHACLKAGWILVTQQKIQWYDSKMCSQLTRQAYFRSAIVIVREWM